MPETEEKQETPDAFLKAIAGKLATTPDIDIDLAKILAANILTVAPAADALARAKAAIVALAEKRATAAAQNAHA
jgi:hypothetical protein